MDRFFECVLFVVGLVFGSFLNVCITRIPRDESIVRPPSHCRECGAPIRWFDNVPVLSFLLLRGRCAACGASIPYRYPAVELLTGVVFSACYLWYGPTLMTLKFCVFSFLLIGLIFMDAETGLLPREFTYSGIVLGLAFAWIAPGDSAATWMLLEIAQRPMASVRGLSLVDGVLGAVFGAGFFYLAWALYYLVRRRHGLGFGDIALMGMVGAFLGLKLVILVIVCAPILTLMYAGFLLVREVFRPKRREAEALGRRADSANADRGAAEERTQAESDVTVSEETPFLQREVPFGVFLGTCALLAIFFGESAWGWYLGKLTHP